MSQEAPITEVVWSFEGLMKDWGLPKLVAQLSEAKRTLMAARKERAALVLSGSARAENSRKQRLAVLDVLNAVHRQQAALMEGLQAGKPVPRDGRYSRPTHFVEAFQGTQMWLETTSQ